MDYIPFNSRNNLHKNKFGAVCEGELIYFNVVLPRNLQCTGVDLVIKSDNGDYEYHPLKWYCMQGENEEWWSIAYTVGKADIYFYHFQYCTSWGRTVVRHNGDCLGKLSMGRHDWQLSVYEKDFSTPDWLKGGLIYQIFPDRFYFSGEKKKNIPDGRILRDDIFNEPEWKPTKEGRVLNNDYFQGDLKGIEIKLDYIASLGVSCIYLNPVFEAHSNHRYDTADYMKIDPLLGTESDLENLCREAEKRNISVVLDGVFSHTGDDSVYFNKYGRYNTVGAYQSADSEFYSWYKFIEYPDKYHSWWGIDILPEVVEESDGFLDYITGENGVARKWLRTGVKGWRLDVADELPDKFLDKFRAAVKKENPDTLILGEVWEDASNKFAYGERRRYFGGKQLDSVMNYPFAEAIISYIRTGMVEGFSNKILNILENYPKCVTDVLMNHIGTHDTMRVITQLVGESCEYRDRAWQSKKKLTAQQYEKGVAFLKLAAVIQYTLPGVPSLYYGDEAGMEGYKDPFNRFCYPWGRENSELIEFYKVLGKMRKECSCLKDGTFCVVSEMLGCLAFSRKNDEDEILVIVNRNNHPIDYYLSEQWHSARCIFGDEMQGCKAKIKEYGYIILKKEI